MLNLVVTLHARDLARLAEFESRAMPILREHGGELLMAFRPEGAGPSGPHEVHVLRFPTRAAFDAYRADGRLAALAPLRQQAIAQTVVHMGEEVLEY